ncbi:MAG: IS110 family transposase [Alphaproteobacteria bacterium]|nr:IS110 family transposase [Alphaproteobacteria bacterium]
MSSRFYTNSLRDYFWTTYKGAGQATIENPDRIRKTRNIAHYLVLTPKIYSSGDVERRGRITKCGPTVMRSLLFEAAQCLLRRVKTLSTLKSWGLRLCKRKNKKIGTRSGDS